MAKTSASSFRQSPLTRPGKWAFILAAAWGLLSVLNNSVILRLDSDTAWAQTVQPLYRILMFLVGLAAGVFGLVAIISRRERSWLIWLSLLVGALTVVQIIAVLLLLLG